MMQKKGAIEFSMTTIIVVIIGVIILAIAIPWLTGILGKAGQLTDAAFDRALNQLKGDPTPDQPIMLSQESFTLSRGEKAALIVRYLNDGKTGHGLDFTSGGQGNPDSWFSFDGTTAVGRLYDWRVTLNIPNTLPSGTGPDYFVRVKVIAGDAEVVSVPIVITVE